MKKELLSTSEAASILGISRIAVFKKVRQGRLPAIMIGGSYALAPEDVEAERRCMARREALRRCRQGERH